MITRGSGFGYMGSVVTNVIYASFTFIFFALEGSMMAQGLELSLGLPLWAGYAVGTFVIIPLVAYGMKILAKMQTWTSPLWLVLMVIPILILMTKEPESVGKFLQYEPSASPQAGIVFGRVVQAMGICLSLMTQIAEQLDYLRFMPTQTEANKRQWKWAMLIAGPGWVCFGAVKQLIGMYLGVYLLQDPEMMMDGHGEMKATEPVYQFLVVYSRILPKGAAILLSTLLVCLSQIKINVTNAYSGSLAWNNAFTRLSKTETKPMIWIIFNLGIALLLMELNMFNYLEQILGFYSNCAIAWVSSVASDIAVNKYYFKISPMVPEFRRGMLYDYNPVGLISFFSSSFISIACFFRLFGEEARHFSPIVALVISGLMPPILAKHTRFSRFYLRRTDDGIDTPRVLPTGQLSDELFDCAQCKGKFERPDMLQSGKDSAETVCSLCVTLDKSGTLVLPESSPQQEITLGSGDRSGTGSIPPTPQVQTKSVEP